MNWKIIVIVIVVLGLGIGGYYYYQSTQAATEPEAEKESTALSDENPTNTPTPAELDKSAFEIEIQNGSGIAGEAGRAQELLEGDEFTVSSTANAESYDYEETVVQASEDVDEEWLDALKESLEGQYTVQSRVEELPEGSEVDVIVIVGSFDDKGESMATEEEETTEEDTDLTPTQASGATNTPTPSPTP